MCIAITSPKNNPIPTDEILKTCFRNNSDGAGFAFNTDNNQVKIVKGFMDFESFITVLHEYDEKYNFFARGVLIHCRIGTSGKTTKEGYCDRSCTHPFPISSKDKHLKKLDCTSNFAVVHNGIIQLTANNKSDLSDTMLFIRDYLTDISSNPGWFYNQKNMNLIYNLIDSKMAILNCNGDIVQTKGFNRGSDGNYYSNDSYQHTYYGLYDYGFYNRCFYDEIDSEYIELECPLMRLMKNETVIFKDGNTEKFQSDFHNLYPVYLTKEGDVYSDYYESIIDNNVCMENLTYLGVGHIINDSAPMEIVPFRKDVVGYI